METWGRMVQAKEEQHQGVACVRHKRWRRGARHVWLQRKLGTWLGRAWEATIRAVARIPWRSSG